MHFKNLFAPNLSSSPAMGAWHVGDPRLIAQGYLDSGKGILSRYQLSSPYWAPHLRQNKKLLLQIVEKLKAEDARPRGTLLVLGAGRLLDIPYEQLFPCFERVLLFDADPSCAQEQQSKLAVAGLPPAQFVHCDLTDSVVEHAALAKELILTADSPQSAAESLRRHFQNLSAPPPQWTRQFADVRLVTSSNLLSQLGYFPREHTRTQFRERFKQELWDCQRAAQALENFLHSVRARHVEGLAGLKNAWAFLSGDYGVTTYELSGRATTPPLPPENDTDILLDESGQQELYRFPVRYSEHADPLYGQQISKLWPPGTPLDGPHRWVWHIIPQGSEQKYQKFGRVHRVEAWVKRPV